MNRYYYPPYYYGPSMESVHYPLQYPQAGQGYPGGLPYVSLPAYGMPAAQPAIAQPAQNGSFISNPRFIKGALIGAAAAYLLTNETVQQSAIKGAVKTWSLLQGGIEEMKERFRDAEAELHAANYEDD